MKKCVELARAILSGNAILITQGGERQVNVLVGKNVTRRYLINSLASIVKAVAV